MDLIGVFRIIFGSIFVLFLPGFVWSYVFFDKKEIDAIERIALSLGFSIALVPLLIFLLNQLLAIKVTLMNSSLIIVGLIGTAICIVFLKRWKKRI